jgi:chromate transporter
VATDRAVERVTLWEIAIVFLKLGTIAFGGPAAHIALMEEEFVRRRGWLTRQEFLDRLGAANLIPGPSSTEMAIYIGHTKRGWPGLMIAGCCFIVPAAALVCLIAAAYVRYGTVAQIGSVLYAVKAVVIAIIVQAFWKLAQTAIKTKLLGLIGVISAVLFGFGFNSLLVLLLAGILASLPTLSVLARQPKSADTADGMAWLLSLKRTLVLPKPMIASVVAAGALAVVPFSLWRLFLTFLKIGSVLFGSGYVLLAFLRADFVMKLHWLTEKQLLDSIAVGQVTPGPVFATATFIGYILGGVPGAVAATVGIFLPGFFMVAVSGPLIPKIRRSRFASAVLDGVVVGSLALMGVVAWQLGRAALVDPLTIAIACVSLLLLLRFRVNGIWLILTAAIIGIIRGGAAHAP